MSATIQNKPIRLKDLPPEERVKVRRERRYGKPQPEDQTDLKKIQKKIAELEAERQKVKEDLIFGEPTKELRMRHAEILKQIGVYSGKLTPILKRLGVFS